MSTSRCGQTRRTDARCRPARSRCIEVFSYGCPACNAFQPVMERAPGTARCPRTRSWCYLPARLRHGGGLADVPARLLRRRRSLGVVASAPHQAMYDAVWKTGELRHRSCRGTGAAEESRSPRSRTRRAPSALAGVKRSSSSWRWRSSFGVDGACAPPTRRSSPCRCDSTPTIIVNGKSRVKRDSLTSNDQLIELVKFLVAKVERPVASGAHAQAPRRFRRAPAAVATICAKRPSSTISVRSGFPPGTPRGPHACAWERSASRRSRSAP